MKIILIGPIAPYKGGISHYNTLLAKHLSKTHNVSVISWKRRFPKFLYPGGEQVEKGKEHIIKQDRKFILDFLNPFTWLKSFFKIQRKKPELIVLDWVTPFTAPFHWTMLFLTKHFTKTKSLLICHNVLPHEKRIFDKFLARLVFKNTDYFIVNSKQDMSDLKKLKPNAKAALGFHPTYEEFKHKEIKKDIKKQLALKTKTILFFGFVREYKGLKYLLKAMPIILKKIDLDLLIVGEFWGDKQEYISLIKKLGIEKNVKLVAEYVPDEDVGNYFAASDIAVLPYTSATQSGIVQLSFGFEKPVITTNVGGLPDAVTHNKTGFLVPPQNPEAIADAVIRFYKEKKSKEFISNIKKEKDRFSWERYVGLIEKIFLSK